MPTARPSFSFRSTHAKVLARLALCAGFALGSGTLRAVTLQAGDLLIGDAGTSVATTKLWQIPVSGTAPITPSILSSQAVGSGTIDTVKLSAASSPTQAYLYDSASAVAAIFAVDPATGNRTSLSSGSTAPALTNANTLEMVWDPVGAQLLLNFGGTSRGIVTVNATTGARAYLTGNGVGTGVSPSANYKGLTVSAAGAIYAYDTVNGLISIDRSTGNRTVVSAASNFTSSVVTLGALGYDNFRSLILVSDAHTTATSTALKWVNPSGGAITTATGGSTSSAPGSGTAIDIARYPVVDASGNIYYRESSGSGTKNIVKVTNPGASNVRSVYSAAANYTAVTVANLAIVPAALPVAPSITSSLAASGTYNTSLSTYTIVGTNTPTSYNATGLPTGLSVNTGNGQITGTPTQSGSFNVALSATNAGGTGTATLVLTISAIAPTVTSPTSASVTATTATLGGDVTSDGSATVTARGVVYALTSANATPALSGSDVTNATGSGTTGVFTVSATGLTASSAYSYRAYATNTTGTAYSSVGTFTTAAAADTTGPTVTSIVRQTPSGQSLTAGTTTATFRVTFSEAVNTPATSNFAVVAVNSSSILGSISSVTAISTSIYDVAVSLSSGTGEFRLKVVD